MGRYEEFDDHDIPAQVNGVYHHNHSDWQNEANGAIGNGIITYDQFRDVYGYQQFQRLPVRQSISQYPGAPQPLSAHLQNWIQPTLAEPLRSNLLVWLKHDFGQELRVQFDFMTSEEKVSWIQPLYTVV